MANMPTTIAHSRVLESVAPVTATDAARVDFDGFHSRTAAPLWRYLRRVTGDPQSADDVLQESFLRYLDRPPRSDDERAHKAYLYRIATNLSRDRWRRRQREEGWLTWLRDRVTNVQAPTPIDLRRDLGQALDQLKPRARALVWLAEVEGRPHKEIADILGLRPGSVRVLLHRARRTLATILRDHGYPENEP